MAEPDIERDTDLTREMAPELDYVIPRDDPGQAHSALAAAGAYAYRHLLNIGRMFGRLHSVRHRGGEADSETHNHNELDPAREDEPPDTPRRFAWFYDKIRQNISLWQNKIVPEDGYTTAAFNNLHRPLPVKDVFFSARLIIVCRLVFRGAIYCSVLPILVNPNGIILLGITGVVAVLRNYKIERVWKVRVPTVRELWSFVKYPQTFWEIAASITLKRGSHRRAGIWWLIYLVISDLSDFEQNFLNAWSKQDIEERQHTEDHAQTTDNRQDTNDRPEGNVVQDGSQENAGDQEAANTQDPGSDQDDKIRKSVHIFVENEHLAIPVISDDITDSVLLTQVRMFYRYLKVKRGLAELVIPRKLIRVDHIALEKRLHLPGERMKTLPFGRGVRFLHHPENAPEGDLITKELKKLSTKGALEFIRALDRGAIGGVITAPPLASLIFATAWMWFFLTRGPDSQGKEVDAQVVVTTAFTVAAYLVTAGALITGLIGYLDSSSREGDLSSKGLQSALIPTKLEHAKLASKSTLELDPSTPETGDSFASEEA